MRTFQFADLGLISYSDCLSLQRELVKLRLAGEIEDTLLLLEHTPVITMGVAGGEESLLISPEKIEQQGIEIHRTDRGGNITYHGPGQLVGYPIFDLRQHGKDVHLLLRNLEQAIVDVLGDYGIAGETTPPLTGVWVGGEKICSIGVAVRRWISYHGFALNVSPNYEHWSLIHPCGLTGKQVTSIGKLIRKQPDMAEVKQRTVEHIAKVFEMEAVPAELTSEYE